MRRRTELASYIFVIVLRNYALASLRRRVMGTLLRSVLSMALLQLAAGAAPAAAAHAPRRRLSLDRGWRFRAFPTRGPMYFNAQDFPPAEWAAVAAPGYDDSVSAGWRALDVPHDFVVEGGFSHGP
jgi:hypothetical protein